MDRNLFYPGAIPLAEDGLNAQRNAMVSDGVLAAAVLGSSPLVDGHACAATNPASRNINVSPGSVFSLQTVDGSQFSTLPIDLRPLVKFTCSLDTSVITIPDGAGTYTICAAFLEQDGGARVMPYYNAANPAMPYSGPNGQGAAQMTQRTMRTAFLVISGSGPAPFGYVPLCLVQANDGPVTQDQISVHPQAVYIGDKLTAKASRAYVDAAVAPLAPKNSPAFTGVPTTPTPPDHDDTHTVPDTIWVNRAIAEATGGLQQGFRQINVFSSSQAWYAPYDGVFRVRVVGAGGGGGGSDGSSTYLSAAGGGAGGYSENLIRMSAGTVVQITVGAGGAGGQATAGSAGGNGGTSSFGSYISSTGGQGGQWGSPNTSAGGQGGGGFGGALNSAGDTASDGQQGQIIKAGDGGSGPFGGRGRAGAGGGGGAGAAPGAGGGGGYSVACTGGAGAPGVVIIEG